MESPLLPLVLLLLLRLLHETRLLHMKICMKN